MKIEYEVCSWICGFFDQDQMARALKKWNSTLYWARSLFAFMLHDRMNGVVRLWIHLNAWR